MITLELHQGATHQEVVEYCKACHEWRIKLVKIKDRNTMNRIREFSDYPHQGGVRLMGITFIFAGK